MKTHRTIQNNLYGYLKGELSAEDAKTCEAHVKSCASCAGELQAMRETMGLLIDKVRRPSEQRNELYWQQFAQKIDRRIQMAPAEDEPQSFVGRLMDVLVENRKPFSFGFASALSLIVLVFAVWSLWIKTPVPGQIASDSAGHTPTGLGVNIEKTSLEARTADYLEQSKVILIGIMNTDTKSLVESKSPLKREREISRTLVRESHDITSELTDPSQQRLRELVSDLSLILMQIANIESDHGAQGVEIVKGGIERNGVLFKINLEEIQRVTRSSPGKGIENKMKSIS